jgi:MerR family transcriptional regulator, copper efflux regulator
LKVKACSKESLVVQIGELARRFGVAPSKIRFLEGEGLVRPVRRTSGGYREYDETSAEALNMILQAQSLGFTIEEIKGALAENRAHGLRRDYLIGQIELKLEQLDRHVAQVNELRARLLCAGNELKARMKNGAKCDTRPSAPLSNTNKPRSAPRVRRRRLTTAE